MKITVGDRVANTGKSSFTGEVGEVVEKDSTNAVVRLNQGTETCLPLSSLEWTKTWRGLALSN